MLAAKRSGRNFGVVKSAGGNVTDIFTDTSLSSNGYMPVDYANYGGVARGVTVCRFINLNFAAGDSVGTMISTYYVDFKDKKSI